MSRHHAGSEDRTPTVERRRRDDVDNRGVGHRLDPRTPVKLCLRDFITLIVAVVAIAGGVVTAWRSLQWTDAQAADRVSVIERRLVNVATKADLRELASGIRLCIVQPATCYELDNIGKAADHSTNAQAAPADWQVVAPAPTKGK